MDQLRLPVAALQQALSHERAQMIIYYVRPTSALGRVRQVGATAWAARYGW